MSPGEALENCTGRHLKIDFKKGLFQKMQIDEVAIKSYFAALWEEKEYEELERGRCEPTFHRH